LRVLYISTKGGIHDYRFLEKLVKDNEVLFLHYSRKPMINEINSIPNLKIISSKPLFGANPLLSHLLHFKKIVKSFKPDIIHSGYVWQVGILPAIIGFHPHLSMVWGSDVLIEPDKNPVIKIMVKKVLTQCDHIQCDAEFVKDKMIKDFAISPDKITVFPWGIDLNLFRPLDKNKCREHIKAERDDFIVIFTRPLEQVYDISSMIKGFGLFAENKKDVKLLINTDGSQRDLLKGLITDDLKDKVKFNGWTKYSELPVYFNAANVYLSTSLSDGTSLALLEAMACRLGIIVTDLPANHEWVDDNNGFIIPTGTPGKVREKLEYYYNYRQILEEHGVRNLQVAMERADWDKNYLRLKEIYSRLNSH
jgi:glycosyltransferase involved in cell wall biosynthesis